MIGSRKSQDVSVKIDGCPAIVWGTDLRQGHFSSHKAVEANKKKIRIAHSHDEIDQHYEGDVDILHDCFDCLPRTDQIIQGDFIGYGGDDTYKPNTIKYVFPEIVRESIIVAPHTLYQSTADLRDSCAMPLVERFESTKEVLFVQPDSWCEDDSFEDVIKFARQMSQMCEFVSVNKARRLRRSLTLL